MERDRLLRGLSLAATDDAEDDRSCDAEFSTFEVNVAPLESEQFTLPQARGCGQENEGAFANSEMVDQSSDFKSGQHDRSAPPLCALADKSHRIAVEQFVPARVVKQD